MGGSKGPIGDYEARGGSETKGLNVPRGALSLGAEAARKKRGKRPSGTKIALPHRGRLKVCQFDDKSAK
jgi:hypothetical protein